MVTIPFSDFQKLEMRVGKIISVEEIPGSEKLYKIIVDFGDEKRQAVAGLRKYYKPEDLLNRQFVFVTNLEKKKIFGVESQCMVLAADDGKGNVVLIKPERDVELGTRIR